MQMDVQIGGRAKALDERDRVGVGRAPFQPRLLEQKSCNDPVDDAQHRREQPGMGGEQNTQRNGNDPLMINTHTRARGLVTRG